MKISTLILRVEHEDDEDPVDVILKAIEFRNYYKDWVDFIDTEDGDDDSF